MSRPSNNGLGLVRRIGCPTLSVVVWRLAKLGYDVHLGGVHPCVTPAPRNDLWFFLDQ